MVALLPADATELGTSSRYLQTPSPKPRPALQRLRARIGGDVDGLLIEWPATSGRIRKVLSRSGTRRRYVVPCYRVGEREAHCEAAEEAAACILLDACSGVEFQEQPARLTFDWQGIPHTHIPDLVVASSSRYEFWECKRESEATQFHIRKRTERLQVLLEPLGVQYRVVTGHELHVGSFLENARLLRRFAKHPVLESTRLDARIRVRNCERLTIGELATALGGVSTVADILSLIYQGKLQADLSTQLSEQSSLHVNSVNGDESWLWQIFALGNG